MLTTKGVTCAAWCATAMHHMHSNALPRYSIPFVLQIQGNCQFVLDKFGTEVQEPAAHSVTQPCPTCAAVPVNANMNFGSYGTCLTITSILYSLRYAMGPRPSDLHIMSHKHMYLAPESHCPRQ